MLWWYSKESQTKMFDSVLRMCDMQRHSIARFKRTEFCRGLAWDKAGYHSSM